jgi:Raf kinase inhibitor-like YbhB/YbcL family protein
MVRMSTSRNALVSAMIALSSAVLLAQPPAGQAPAPGQAKGKGPARVVFSVSSTSFPDGGEVPMKNAGLGENKSPEFTFHWTAANNPAPTPEALQSYAVIFHDMENSTNRTAVDTLHWQAFNIPGTAKGLPEGLGTGDLADGTRNGAGIAAGRPNGQPGYFGPGAGVGPFHHYMFEFYALDTKLTLPATATRDELVKAMETHVIGKAAYVGRYHAVQ